MEIKKDYRRVMTVEMMADDSIGYDEIKPFISAMKKIYEDSSKVGFVNRFSTNEQMILKGIWETIKEEHAETVVEEVDKETGKGTQSSGV